MIATVASLMLAMAPVDVQEIKIPKSLASFKMVKIPAGSLKTASGEVKIGEFWMGQTEVTWDTYDIFAFKMDLSDEEKAANAEASSRPSKPYGAPDRGFGHKGYAALGPHLNAAENYCKWLSRTTGKKFRLATPEEWEYAARAGESGAAPSGLDKIAWLWENSDDIAHPVGKLQANGWGLYDMFGNVTEWVRDSNGTGWVMGGAFGDKRSSIRYETKKPYDPTWQEADAHVPKSKWWLSNGEFIGFRVVSVD